jgi:hypothetical protein
MKNVHGARLNQFFMSSFCVLVCDFLSWDYQAYFSGAVNYLIPFWMFRQLYLGRTKGTSSMSVHSASPAPSPRLTDDEFENRPLLKSELPIFFNSTVFCGVLQH